MLSSIRFSQFWVLDDKCRHTFEAHGRDLSRLRSNIQRLVQAFQTGAYQVPSGFAMAPPPAPFALQAASAEVPTPSPVLRAADRSGIHTSSLSSGRSSARGKSDGGSSVHLSVRV